VPATRSPRSIGSAESGADPLRFGSDHEPGIRRAGTKRFTYRSDTTGRAPSSESLARIRALVIPPAWTDVWIADDPHSHLQATGRDARGRKQYRYHPAFTASQADDKFNDLLRFGNALGALRRRVTRDLARRDLDHDRVVATIVRILDATSLRVGNTVYADTNESFGLTTLRNQHVVIRGTVVRFAFRGKSAHEFDVRFDNPRLAKIVRQCQHLPGQQLFEYRTEAGEVRRVGSNDVNSYLGDHAAIGVTAKTFRTWNASVRAADGLAAASADGATPTKRALNEVIDSVADHLGNTRAVCRKSYIHPVIVQSYIDGTLPARWSRPVGGTPAGLSIIERKTLRLLRRAGSTQRRVG
jgi:DNA topoisomerase-1